MVCFFNGSNGGPYYADIDLQSNLEIRTRANGAEDESVLSTRTSPALPDSTAKFHEIHFIFLWR